MSTQIEGQDFTGFYDYDELESGKLWRLSDAGRIDWFQLRTSKVFLNPLKCIINSDPKANNPLWQSDKDFMIASFSVILNGVESLGAFLSGKSQMGESHNNFKMFIDSYMEEWAPLEKQLWEDFRNGMTHGFQIRNGAIEYRRGKSEKHWLRQSGGYSWLVIDPEKLLEDLEQGTKRFFENVRNDDEAKMIFLKMIKEIYPPRKMGT
ncbi:MAG: hypothetical protein AB1439_08095 [candidate division FCPU426 bacterium]